MRRVVERDTRLLENGGSTLSFLPNEDHCSSAAVLQIRDMAAASFCTTGWTRGKPYRAVGRHGIPSGYGRP